MKEIINQEVTIYLNNPLMTVMEDIPDDIHRLKAKIIASEATGFVVQIRSLGNEKKWLEEPRFLKKIFLPIHKIDFMALD